MTANPPYTDQRRPYIHRTCPACGEAFVARIWRHVYCSVACWNAHHMSALQHAYYVRHRSERLAYAARRRASKKEAA